MYPLNGQMKISSLRGDGRKKIEHYTNQLILHEQHKTPCSLSGIAGARGPGRWLDRQSPSLRRKMKRRLLIWAAHAPTDGHYPKHRPPRGVARTPSPAHAMGRPSAGDSRRPPPVASLLLLPRRRRRSSHPPCAGVVRSQCGTAGLDLDVGPSTTAASGFCSGTETDRRPWQPTGDGDGDETPTKSAETIAGRGRGSSPWPRAAAPDE